MADPMNWTWHERAKCSTDPPAPGFFWPWKETEVTDRQVAEFCSTCPVRLKCFEHSMAAEEPVGYWGGVPESQRKEWLREGRQFRCATCEEPLDPLRIARYKGRELRRCNKCLT